MEIIMQTKFKVGDTVRCVSSKHSYITFGRTYIIKEIRGSWYKIVTDHGGLGGYMGHVFELVEPNSVLTPEEVFEHLRKGTKLQRQLKDVPSSWITVDHSVYVHQIDDYVWRIKPEPEVIELNGKRYKLIED